MKSPEKSDSERVEVAQPRLVRHLLTLDEFVFEQQKSLADFENSWREFHQKNAEVYPLEMLAGDWSEQLSIWRERVDFPPNEADTRHE